MNRTSLLLQVDQRKVRCLCSCLQMSAMLSRQRRDAAMQLLKARRAHLIGKVQRARLKRRTLEDECRRLEQIERSHLLQQRVHLQRFSRGYTYGGFLEGTTLQHPFGLLKVVGTSKLGMARWTRFEMIQYNLYLASQLAAVVAPEKNFRSLVHERTQVVALIKKCTHQLNKSFKFRNDFIIRIKIFYNLRYLSCDDRSAF